MTRDLNMLNRGDLKMWGIEIQNWTIGEGFFSLWEFSFYHSGILDYPSWLSRRTTLLALLATALGGVWTLEQPSGSLLEYYPTWRQAMNMMFKCGGEYAVSPSVLLGQAVQTMLNLFSRSWCIYVSQTLGPGLLFTPYGAPPAWGAMRSMVDGTL